MQLARLPKLARRSAVISMSKQKCGASWQVSRLSKPLNRKMHGFQLVSRIKIEGIGVLSNDLHLR